MRHLQAEHGYLLDATMNGADLLQERTKRNAALFFLPIALLGFSCLLLLWSLVRINLPAPILVVWPWRLQLLDIQSATTAVTIAAGLIFARGQYATAVRPMIGWSGRVVETRALSDKRVWLVRLSNGSTAPAVFHSLSYAVVFKDEQGDVGAAVGHLWLSREEVINRIDAKGLKHEVNYDIRFFGPSVSLSVATVEGNVLALFTKRAMSVIDDLLIRVKATDQAGDTHQRVIHCLRGAVRNPRSPTLE
jgi:hypothetical protein